MVPDGLDEQVTEAGCPLPATCLGIFRALDAATYGPNPGRRAPFGLTTSQIVHSTHLSHRTVQRHLPHLADSGLASRARPGSGRREALWSACNPVRTGSHYAAPSSSVVTSTPSRAEEVGAVGPPHVTPCTATHGGTTAPGPALPPAADFHPEVDPVAPPWAPEVDAVGPPRASTAGTWPEVAAPGSRSAREREALSDRDRYVTTSDPPSPVAPGEPWPFAPERYWEPRTDATGTCRPNLYGLAPCAECRTAPGERWPGQAHAYCDLCRGVPARPPVLTEQSA